MAGYFSPLSAPRAEMNISEMNEKLCCQLEASKGQFQDLKEKFFVSEAIAYTFGQPAVEIQLVL
jgi:hypothetical protein|uniref:Uncharacterized protein n=1 Tax=Castor canadensis TaxID=51338 RepID=A0A8C0W258_CASCN